MKNVNVPQKKLKDPNKFQRVPAKRTNKQVFKHISRQFIEKRNKSDKKKTHKSALKQSSKSLQK